MLNWLVNLLRPRRQIWGYDYSFDCNGGDVAAVTSPEAIKDFCADLVKSIDMKTYGEPQVVHFAEHDPEKAGYTLVQLLYTSAIVVHFIDKDGSFYGNVFSCKPFTAEDVDVVVKKHFSPATIRSKMRERFVYEQPAPFPNPWSQD